MRLESALKLPDLLKVLGKGNGTLMRWHFLISTPPIPDIILPTRCATLCLLPRHCSCNVWHLAGLQQCHGLPVTVQMQQLFDNTA